MTQEQSDECLKEPISYLQSITKVASPYYKLQCVFYAYKSILNILSNDSTPNADDVIPTFIYTLLRANPKDLISNIYTYEVFSQTNNLGETGYAFTNLIASIQFLLHVDIRMADSNNDDNHNYIHVSLEAHKQFIANLEQEKTKESIKNEATNVTAPGEQSCEQSIDKLSVHMVRQARLNKINEPSQHPNIQTITTKTPRTCDYTFLGKKLQDIRVQDVPLLLQEYHTILYAYEELVMELKKKEISDTKQNILIQREMLEHNYSVQKDVDEDS